MDRRANEDRLRKGGGVDRPPPPELIKKLLTATKNFDIINT